MRKFLFLLSSILIVSCTSVQVKDTPPKTEIMTLGVFHFAYPNLDAIKTADEDQISVLDEPYQSEIIAISKAICDFKPTIIVVEFQTDVQNTIDSLYLLYKDNKYNLGKNEVYQLGFRIGRQLNLPKIYCVDDWGQHYNNIESIFKDSIRLAKFGEYIENSPDSIYENKDTSGKVSSIIDEFTTLNDPNLIKEDLSSYLLNSFKYEEQPGDFTGVDFETGRWFNRNLRIFRNVHRVPHTADDRILMIYGAGQLNLLNLFFDASKEFELVSPLPYLKKARK